MNQNDLFVLVLASAINAGVLSLVAVLDEPQGMLALVAGGAPRDLELFQYLVQEHVPATWAVKVWGAVQYEGIAS